MEETRCKEGYPQDTCNIDGFKCPQLSREKQKQCMLYVPYSANNNKTKEMI